MDVGHGDVGDEDVLDGGAVDGEEFDAAVRGVVNVAIGDGDVFEVGHGFGAGFDGALAGFEFAVGDLDILAGHGAGGGFEADGVVAGVDFAVGDLHGLAAVDVDAVVVGDAAADDADGVDGDVFAVEEIGGPGGGVAEVEIGDFYAVAFDHADEEGAASPDFGGGAGLGGGDGFALSVESAAAGDGNVFGFYGGEEGPADLRAEAVGEGIDVLVIFEVGGSEERGFGVEVEGDVVFEEEGAGEEGAGGIWTVPPPWEEQASMAFWMAGESRVLPSPVAP